MTRIFGYCGLLGVILFSFSVIVPSLAQEPVAPATPIAGWQHQAKAAPVAQAVVGRALGNILYNQFQNSGGTIAVQDFETAFDSFDSEGADDFSVPAGGWSIGGVYVTGNFSNGTGFTPTTTVHVKFYADDNGLPGTAVCTLNDLLPLSYTGGDLLLKLPTPCDLGAGHYWLSVQPEMPNVPNGQWAWEWNLTQTNHPSVWRNPGDGFGSGCTDWEYLVICFEGWGPDLSFVLYEPLMSPTSTPTETPTVTPTNTETPTATLIPTIEILANGSFEDDTDSDNVPDLWVQKFPTNDKRKCNKPNKVIAYAGNCTYQFKSAPGEKSQLRQDIDLALLPVEANAGDILTLNGYVNARGRSTARSVCG